MRLPGSPEATRRDSTLCQCPPSSQTHIACMVPAHSRGDHLGHGLWQGWQIGDMATLAKGHNQPHALQAVWTSRSRPNPHTYSRRRGPWAPSPVRAAISSRSSGKFGQKPERDRFPSPGASNKRGVSAATSVAMRRVSSDTRRSKEHSWKAWGSASGRKRRTAAACASSPANMLMFFAWNLKGQRPYSGLLTVQTTFARQTSMDWAHTQVEEGGEGRAHTLHALHSASFESVRSPPPLPPLPPSPAPCDDASTTAGASEMLPNAEASPPPPPPPPPLPAPASLSLP